MPQYLVACLKIKSCIINLVICWSPTCMMLTHAPTCLTCSNVQTTCMSTCQACVQVCQHILNSWVTCSPCKPTHLNKKKIQTTLCCPIVQNANWNMPEQFSLCYARRGSPIAMRIQHGPKENFSLKSHESCTQESIAR